MHQRIIQPAQLGMLLTSARKARGLNQTAAGVRLGVSQSRLSALELNPGTITVEQLLPLLANYGLELIVNERGKEIRNPAPAEW